MKIPSCVVNLIAMLKFLKDLFFPSRAVLEDRLHRLAAELSFENNVIERLELYTQDMEPHLMHAHLAYWVTKVKKRDQLIHCIANTQKKIENLGECICVEEPEKFKLSWRFILKMLCLIPIVEKREQSDNKE